MPVSASPLTYSASPAPGSLSSTKRARSDPSFVERAHVSSSDQGVRTSAATVRAQYASR